MADNREPRYPRNLQGLLRFCTENTKQEDAPGTMEPMSDERRRWLAEAMEAMTESDPIKRMLENIQILLDNERPVEEQEEALETITEYCEDIDIANDFHKLGGGHILPRLLDGKTSGIRWRTAALIATLTQNNPNGQREVLEAGLMPELLKKLDSDSESEQTRIKSLYAISCLIRNCPETETEFIRLDGFSFLLRAMQTNVEKLQIKAAFILASQSHDNPTVKDLLCKMGMVEQLIALLHSEHSVVHEHLMSALLNLITGNPLAQIECHRPEFHLNELLCQRIQLLKDDAQFQ